MRFIADANVLLPLLLSTHPHRAEASSWWDRCGDGEVGLCLPVEMAVLRLLSNPRVMGTSVQKPESAWSAVEALAADPRIVALRDFPPSHAGHWRGFIAGREPSPNLWTDAWLAALAQATGCQLVTFDRGFRAFRGLKLELLAVD